MEVHRGEVFYADLSPVVGSEQGGIRPVLIIQNEIGKDEIKLADGKAVYVEERAGGPLRAGQGQHHFDRADPHAG